MFSFAIRAFHFKIVMSITYILSTVLSILPRLKIGGDKILSYLYQKLRPYTITKFLFKKLTLYAIFKLLFGEKN